MIKIKPFTPDLYDQVKAWWEAYGIHPVDISCLPATSATAWHVDEDGLETFVAAAWVYLDSSVGFSCLCWPVTNPDANARIKFKGMSDIVNILQSHVADDLGYGLMLTFSSVESVTCLMERQGFTRFDNDVTCLSKGLQCHQ